MMEFLLLKVEGDDQQTVKFEVWQMIKLMTGLPGLFSLCILGVI